MGVGERGEGKKYNVVVTEQSWGLRCSIGNIVDDVVVTVYGARRAIGIAGSPLWGIWLSDHYTKLCTRNWHKMTMNVNWNQKNLKIK